MPLALVVVVVLASDPPPLAMANVTATLASGCLAGVTRALVLEWYGGREVDEPISVLERASEMFLVSTTRDVQGVHHLDGREYPAPGPITQKASDVWVENERQHLDP